MANQSFTGLLEQVRSCRLCEPALPEGARPVFQLHPKAKIVIVGQAPGRRVHQSGIPFDDVSGDRLRDWMGIDKTTFYNPEQIAILPMGLCYPGTGKQGDLPPRPECAPAWHSQLLEQLVDPQLMLVIGHYAHHYHLDKQETVTELVQAWQDVWPEKLPLPHPSPRNNIWLKKNTWFEQDVIPALQHRVNSLIK